MKRNSTLNLKKLKLGGKVQKRSSLHIAHIKYLLTQGNNLRFPQGLIREGHVSLTALRRKQKDREVYHESSLWEEARIQGKSTRVGRQAAGDGHGTKV